MEGDGLVREGRLGRAYVVRRGHDGGVELYGGFSDDVGRGWLCTSCASVELMCLRVRTALDRVDGAGVSR